MSVLPTAPSRSDPSTFAALADDFLAALPGFGDYMEVLALATSAGAFKGTYAGGTTYAAGDVVSSSDVLYTSLQASNTGNTPASSPTYWKAILASKADTASPTFTGTAVFAVARGGASNAVSASAIDCSAGHVFTKTATGALTWTFTNVPAGFYAGVLELTNGGLGTQTFPSGSKWASGTAPSLSSSGLDTLTFYTSNGGTTWHWAVRAKAEA